MEVTLASYQDTPKNDEKLYKVREEQKQETEIRIMSINCMNQCGRIYKWVLHLPECQTIVLSYFSQKSLHNKSTKFRKRETPTKLDCDIFRVGWS